jgi:hypothetical protein
LAATGLLGTGLIRLGFFDKAGFTDSCFLDSFLALFSLPVGFFGAGVRDAELFGGVFFDAAIVAGALAATVFFLKALAPRNMVLTADFKTFLTVVPAPSFLPGFATFFAVGRASFDLGLTLRLAMSCLYLGGD